MPFSPCCCYHDDDDGDDDNDGDDDDGDDGDDDDDDYQYFLTTLRLDSTSQAIEAPGPKRVEALLAMEPYTQDLGLRVTPKPCLPFPFVSVSLSLSLPLSLSLSLSLSRSLSVSLSLSLALFLPLPKSSSAALSHPSEGVEPWKLPDPTRISGQTRRCKTLVAEWMHFTLFGII